MIRFALALAAGLLAAPAHAEIEVKEITSPGGIDAWLLESHEIPFIALEVVFEGGANLDRDGKRGAVNLMTALIEEGAGDLDAQAFQLQLQSLAADFGYEVFDDGLGVSARFLTETREEAIGLLHQSLTEPRFDQVALDRVRGQVLSNIRSRATDPGDIASDAFYGAAFGAHPYGSDLSGTEDSVAALTRDDIVQAFDDTVVRSRAKVAVVGDITAEEAGVMLDRLFDGMPEDGPPLPEDVEIALEGGVTVVEFPSPQSVAFFGHAGVDRDSPDFFAAYILNEILGGSGRQSILMEEVREKRGLTYGVGSYLVPKAHTDLFLGSVASANDRVAEAIEVIRAEWAEMAETGVTAEQLAEAKTYITGAYPLRFDGNQRIAGILANMQFNGFPADYFQTRNAQMEAVTLEEINRVASELLRPDDLHFVVVGEPDGLSES